ncbi:MAG: hypothetical protein ACRCX8_12575 [Sarcina sp.]
MLYAINRNEMKNVMFGNIMGRIITKTPGMEGYSFDNATNTVVSNFIGLDFNTVKEYLKGEPATEAHILIKGLINSIESRVEKYGLENFEIEAEPGISDKALALKAYRHMVGLEAEEEKEEEGNPFGETVTDSDIDEKVEEEESTVAVMVAELIKEIVKTDAKEVTELAERVVELSKENNETAKEDAEGEEDIFSTTDDDDDENKDGDDGDDDESKDKKNKKDDKGGNPFEDDGDESNKDDGEDKPKKDNPFDDEGSEDNKDEDKAGFENSKIKMIGNLKCRMFGLEKVMYTDVESFEPFAGLENGSFNKLAKYVADKLEGEALIEAYTNFGLESENYITAKKSYSKTARQTLNAGIATILTASILNLPVNAHKLSQVDLFE